MSTSQDESQDASDQWAQTQVQGAPDQRPAAPFGASGYGAPGSPGYGAPGYGAVGHESPAYVPPTIPPGYGAIAHAPSGAAAITAGVLALLGAVAQLFILGITVIAFVGLSAFAVEFGEGVGGVAVFVGLMCVISLAIVVVLTLGGVNLLRGKQSGRIMTAIGSVVMILLQGILLVIVLIAPSEGVLSMVFNVLFFLFPVATLILALLPQTSEWIAAKEASRLVPVFYPPPSYGYGGYGQGGYGQGGYGQGGYGQGGYGQGGNGYGHGPRGYY